jgi:hypothetical protein
MLPGMVVGGSEKESGLKVLICRVGSSVMLFSSMPSSTASTPNVASMPDYN